MTGAEFARSAATFGPRYEQNQTKAVSQAALFTKTQIVAAASAARWPARPGWVKYDLGIRDGGPAAILTLRGRRAWLFELGANPHAIGVRNSRGQKAQRAIARRALLKQGRTAEAAAIRSKQVLANRAKGFGPVVGPVQHPGFRGRPYFLAGARTAAPGVHRILGGSFTDTVKEVLAS